MSKKQIPIRTENINDYKIHNEFYSIPLETIKKLKLQKKSWKSNSCWNNSFKST